MTGGAAVTGPPTSTFVLDGDLVAPTVHAASPWNPATQAGGAPAALLAQLADEQGTAGLRAARATVDILGPIPMAPGRVDVERVRATRATELLDASLSVEGVEVLRVGLWRVAPVPRLPTAGPSADPPLPAPEDVPDHTPPPALFADEGFVAATRWRLVSGGFDRPGPAVAWSRPRYPLLPGTAPPSISRLLLACATANGLGSVLDLSAFLAIDVDLTVHLERDLDGPWLRTRAETRLAEGGAGHVTATFDDRHGRVGRGAQTLLVAPRRARR